MNQHAKKYLEMRFNMQKNKGYLPQPPQKNKNKMKLLPPLLDRKDFSKIIEQKNGSFDQYLMEENKTTEKILAELMQKA